MNSSFTRFSYSLPEDRIYFYSYDFLKILFTLLRMSLLLYWASSEESSSSICLCILRNFLDFFCLILGLNSEELSDSRPNYSQDIGNYLIKVGSWFCNYSSLGGVCNSVFFFLRSYFWWVILGYWNTGIGWSAKCKKILVTLCTSLLSFSLIIHQIIKIDLL